MPPRNKVVSVCPWFKVHEGKLAEFKALLPRLIAQTAPESGCLFYDFTVNGDVIHCREAYVGGEAAVAHVQSVMDLIGECLTISDLQRLEVHGSAEELSKMKTPLKGLPIEWFTLEASLEK